MADLQGLCLAKSSRVRSDVMSMCARGRGDRLNARAREQGELPVRAVLDNAQDVDRAVIALELAVTVIRAKPLIDDLDDRNT